MQSGGRKAEELLKKKRESGLQMCSGAAQKSGFVSGEKTQFLLKCTGNIHKIDRIPCHKTNINKFIRIAIV